MLFGLKEKKEGKEKSRRNQKKGWACPNFRKLWVGRPTNHMDGDIEPGVYDATLLTAGDKGGCDHATG